MFEPVPDTVTYEGRMMVNLMFRDENLGCHHNNWDALVCSGAVDGNNAGWDTEEA